MKNDIGYEYRVFTNRIFDVESMEVGICTSKNIKEIKPKDKVNGRFFHKYIRKICNKKYITWLIKII